MGSGRETIENAGVPRGRKSSRGSPAVSDPALARELYGLPIDAPIGEELFTIVAALLVHVFEVESTLEAERSA